MGHFLWESRETDFCISIHPSRVGWDVSAAAAAAQASHFNPPIPCGMGPGRYWPQRWQSPDFNPPIPCGMGPVEPQPAALIKRFQSTHPVWDGTAQIVSASDRMEHFNPPIPCGMGPHIVQLWYRVERISIHPSRVGWDTHRAVLPNRRSYFNPPIPCGMGHRTRLHRLDLSDFNPPIPCGMGRRAGGAGGGRGLISIHPSRVGWDAQKSRRA